MSQAGARVRLKGDPGRVGVTTGRFRERGGLVHWQVVFPDSTSWVPEDQTAPAEEAYDPIELLSGGQVGRAVDLRRLLTHVRLTGRLANLIYSLDATGTDFYAYQFKPVLKMLDSPTGGLLIADEVGLGKTIEAGLVWTELRARFDLTKLLVVCPAVLQQKWCQELSIRFGVDAQPGGAREVLRVIGGDHPGRRDGGFALVASLQGLRRRKVVDEDPDLVSGPADELSRLLDAAQGSDPLIDLLVVDEAHYLRNPETGSWRVGHALRQVAQYMLLLSATPIHLRNRDLFQLLHLVDEDTFQDADQFEHLLNANAPLVEARELLLRGRATPERITSLLQEALAHPLLRDSHQLTYIQSSLAFGECLGRPSTRGELAQRLDRANLLAQAVTRTRKREVTEWRVLRQATPEFIPMSETERAFYEGVTGVVRRYAQRVAAHEGFLLATPQRQVASSMVAALDEWRRRIPALGDESGFPDDLDDGLDADSSRKLGPLVGEIVGHVARLPDLDDLRVHDSKFERLRAVLAEAFREESKTKVVVFSYYRPTLNYLYDRLARAGFRVFLIHGGTEGKMSTIESFRGAAPPAVLLSSEVGSEGLDLQFARIVVNYDLPWNPMKVEQRIGRLDRIGQEAPKITVWSLLHQGTIEERVYRRLLDRLKIFERALGGLEPIIGEEIRALTHDLLTSALTPAEEEERISQTAQALENARREEEELESEAPQLVAYGDYILQQVQAARELSRRIDGSDLWDYVRDFLVVGFPGCEFSREPDNKELARITLSTDAKRALQALVRDKRLPYTELASPGTGAVVCKFVNNTSARIAGRQEIVNQFHPLIRFVNAQQSEAQGALFPVAAVELATRGPISDLPSGAYAFAVQRWSIWGVQEIERLAYAAVFLDGPSGALAPNQAELLVTSAASSGRDWLAAAGECSLARAAELVDQCCLGQLNSEFQRFVADVKAQNHDRAEVQLRTLESRYARQSQSLHEVLARHRVQGRDGLVRATEGRIKALRERAEMRRRDIEERRTVRYRQDDVCIGVIKVVGVD